MQVSIDGGAPKWMVYKCLQYLKCKNPTKIDDLGRPGYPNFVSETLHCSDSESASGASFGSEITGALVVDVVVMAPFERWDAILPN